MQTPHRGGRVLQTDALIPPHGGRLVNLIAGPDRARELRAASNTWSSWDLTPRQLCDLELLAVGAFSPLTGFMTRRDYEPVCDRMRLADGVLWPIPVTLDVSSAVASLLVGGQSLALRDPEGVMLAVVHVEDVWRPDREAEARFVYGTTSREHPGVAAVLDRHPCLVGGRVEAIQLPVHYDFRALRQTPADVRADMAIHGWQRVIGFHTRNPMHRADRDLTLQAAQELDAHVLIQPIVGTTEPHDVDHYIRVRCHESVVATYPPALAKLALLPLAVRMAGPREAVWQAIVGKNFGCTHVIVERDRGGPGSDSSVKPLYGPCDAQELLREHEAELGVAAVPFRTMVFVKNLDRYVPAEDVPAGGEVLELSGTQLGALLAEGQEIPAWFTFPDVLGELRRAHPPRRQQGLTVFFTGLSGSGKSTTANVLLVKCLERGGRPVTLLDGDIVRKHLSSELGFSKEHRDIHIRRIGFVASQITRNGGIAICAAIAPYDAIRKEVRAMIEPVGGFVLVHTATPMDVCEQRDRKGLYARARAGVVQHFTGVSDPFESPGDADVVIDTTKISPEQAADAIIRRLQQLGFALPDI